MFDRGKKDNSDGATDLSGEDYALGATGGAPTTTPRSTGEMAVIGRSIRINGDLQGEEDLRIEGDVTGTVQLTNNTLTIGSEGKINANVYAKSVTVEGLMNGDLFGSERIVIRKNAKVDGNITAPRVSLEDGARFKGSIEMDPAAVEKAFGAQSGAVRSSVATDAPAKIASNAKRGANSEVPTKASINRGAKTESLI